MKIDQHLKLTKHQLKISTHISDGLLAAPALGIKEVHVVLLAVGQAILLVEVALLQRNAAVGALEAVGVPHLVQRVDGLLLSSKNQTINLDPKQIGPSHLHQ